MKSQFICPQCRNSFESENGRANRAKRDGLPLYCGRVCAGKSRQTLKLSAEEQKSAKAEYDRQYREKNIELIKVKKAKHYQATRDPEKERIARKANMHKHVEYCRQPEYKAKKAEYDKRKRFEEYGEFAEVAMLLEELEKEISSRATRYEIYVANGRYTRSAIQRRREIWQNKQNLALQN